MRLLADTNITAGAVRALRERGFEVIYVGERPRDPGDEALLAEALAGRRVLLTKDHDFGELIFAKGAAHCGIILIDDLGGGAEEAALLVKTIEAYSAELTSGAFLRVEVGGVRRR